MLSDKTVAFRRYKDTNLCLRSAFITTLTLSDMTCKAFWQLMALRANIRPSLLLTPLQIGFTMLLKFSEFRTLNVRLSSVTRPMYERNSCFLLIRSFTLCLDEYLDDISASEEAIRNSASSMLCILIACIFKLNNFTVLNRCKQILHLVPPFSNSKYLWIVLRFTLRGAIFKHVYLGWAIRHNWVQSMSGKYSWQQQKARNELSAAIVWLLGSRLVINMFVVRFIGGLVCVCMDEMNCWSNVF